MTPTERTKPDHHDYVPGSVAASSVRPPRQVNCKTLIPAALLVLATGCATQPAAVTFLRPDSHLAVLQLPPAVSDDSLRRVLHPDEKEVPVDALAADKLHLAQLVQASLAEALAKSGVPLLASAEFTSFEGFPAMSVGQPLDGGSLTTLRAQHPADAYLRIQVTDYGQTPKDWKSAYVTFEVVSTLAIGGLLYVHKSTRPLAVLYLAQEGIEEYGEGYAGWWLLNRLSRPVRVDADLIDGTSGAVLWHGSETGMAGWQWGHLWHMDQETQGDLLRISTDRMVDDLVTDLGGK